MGLIDANSNKEDLSLCTFPKLKGKTLNVQLCHSQYQHSASLSSHAEYIIFVFISHMNIDTHTHAHCIIVLVCWNSHTYSHSSLPLHNHFSEYWNSFESLCTLSSVIRKMRVFCVPFPSHITWDKHSMSGTTNVRHISRQVQCIILSSLVWWEWKGKLPFVSNQFATLESCLNTCMHIHCNVKQH